MTNIHDSKVENDPADPYRPYSHAWTWEQACTGCTSRCASCKLIRLIPGGQWTHGSPSMTNIHDSKVANDPDESNATQPSRQQIPKIAGADVPA